MAKVGRNDPCPCGSGKKYKQCHLPIEEAQRADQLQLRRAADTLVPKIVGQAQEQTDILPAAMARYWNRAYQVDQLGELDEREDRGAERFLSWLAFDYRLEDGRTLVERMLDSVEEIGLTPHELRLLPTWSGAHLRAYRVDGVRKGHGVSVSDLYTGERREIEDHNASRVLLLGDVLIAHLVPAADQWYVAGAAAHLSEDTAAPLREYGELHMAALRRERPDAGWADLWRDRSELLNHFVMRLPIDKPEPGLLDRLVAETREQLGLAEQA